MVFSSMHFLWIFLPLVFITYYFANNKIRNYVLLFFSIIFYAWGEPKYIFLMLFSILINYIIGILLDRNSNHKKIAKLILLLAIIINLGLLGYYKYFNFIVDIINNIFNFNAINLREIALPIGISFYTFQILSYDIDLYNKKINVQKNIFNLALYVTFFPQLIAGPIVKYKEVENEMNNRTVNINDIAQGIKKFTYGLSKKVIISNFLAITVDKIFDAPISSLNTPIVWLAAIAYTLQIYFDFSGYSDMAIGLGRMFGFHFNENFNLPYLSKSITEFWRRWHISLSTWFKEYLYIPLGGNRKGNARTYINLMIVFFATGLWHGASWNFICWGLYYGIFLIIERLFLKKKLDKSRFFSHIYALLIIVIGWVMFRVDSIQSALNIYKLMFSFNFNETYFLTQHIINPQFVTILMVALFSSGPIHSIVDKINRKNNNIIKSTYEKYFEILIVLILLILCIFELSSNGYNPFIYFRF